uniref:Uncharacterized protein n=1 Tax=Leersia perrieri TaxID=77586 RepID=A0A0D9WJP6_9ORYZ
MGRLRDSGVRSSISNRPVASLPGVDLIARNQRRGAAEVPAPPRGGEKWKAASLNYLPAFVLMSASGYERPAEASKRTADDILAEFFGSSSPFSGMGGGPGIRMSGGGRGSGFGGGADGHHHGVHAGGGGKAVKAPAIERKLPCSLEELYKGTTKKMKISREIEDNSGGGDLTIEVKPGWKKGTKITFPEKGNEQPNIIPADIVFIIDEKPHPVFTRDGNDLVVTQKIPLAEALSGYTVHLTTLDDRSLTIPISSIIHSGYEEVVSGEGMPIRKGTSKKGNLRVKFDIEFHRRNVPGPCPSPSASTSAPPQRRMCKPVFTTVDQLCPQTHGHTLTARVLFSRTILDKPPLRARLAECLVADQTGAVLFTARNQQVDLVKPGTTVIFRNAKIDMFKRTMRLAVDKWGCIEVAEHASFQVNEDNNGNLMVKFDIKFPSRLTADQKSGVKRLLGQ